MPRVKDNDMDDKVANRGSGGHTDGAVSTAVAPQVQHNPMNDDTESGEGNVMSTDANASADHHEVQELVINHASLKRSHDEVVLRNAELEKKVQDLESKLRQLQDG